MTNNIQDFINSISSTIYYSWDDSKISYSDSDGNYYYMPKYSTFSDYYFDKDYTIEEIFENPSERLLTNPFFSKHELKPCEDFYMHVTDFSNDIVRFNQLVITPFNHDGFIIEENKVLPIDEFRAFIIDNEFKKSRASTWTITNASRSVNDSFMDAIVFKCGTPNLFFALSRYYSQLTLERDKFLFASGYNRLLNDALLDNETIGLLDCRGEIHFYPNKYWDEIIKHHKTFNYAIKNNEIPSKEFESRFWRNLKTVHLAAYCDLKNTCKNMGNYSGNKWKFNDILKEDVFQKLDNKDVKKITLDEFDKFLSSSYKNFSDVYKRSFIYYSYGNFSKINSILRSSIIDVFNSYVKFDIK